MKKHTVLNFFLILLSVLMSLIILLLIIGSVELKSTALIFPIVLCVMLLLVFVYVVHSNHVEVKNYDGSIVIHCKHVNGLPLPENMSCTIRSYPDKFKVISSSANFTIDRKKIIDISKKTDVEIQKQYVSSIGGAAAGAVLFGPIGAIIGGRAKQKTNKNFLYYLIVSYRKDGDLAYLAFEVNQTDSNVSSLLKEFKQNNVTQKLNYEL